MGMQRSHRFLFGIERNSICAFHFLQVERVLSDIVTKTTASVGPHMFALTQLARDVTERKQKSFLTPPEVCQVATGIQYCILC